MCRRGDNDCDQRTHPCNTKQTGLKSGIVPRSGVCRACMKNVKYVSRQIKAENWAVCKQFSKLQQVYTSLHIINVYILYLTVCSLYKVLLIWFQICGVFFSKDYSVKVNSPAVPSGRFWIMRGKLVNDEGNKKVVRLFVPCKCCMLNKTGQFVLLTDTAVQGRTVRLGDSDLLLPRDQRLIEVINRKRKRCRNVGSSWFVQQLKKRAMLEVGQFIDRILPRTTF